MDYIKIVILILIIILSLLSIFFDLLIILNGLFLKIFKGKSKFPINNDNIKILEHISHRNSDAHNSTLISILLQYLTLDINQLEKQKSIIIQVRLFYAAILAGLVSYLFSNHNPMIALFILFFILVMYLQEVHINDLINRSECDYHVRRKAVEILINLKPESNRWYF
jgi:hypothetical protein